MGGATESAASLAIIKLLREQQRMMMKQKQEQHDVGAAKGSVGVHAVLY